MGRPKKSKVENTDRETHLKQKFQWDKNTIEEFTGLANDRGWGGGDPYNEFLLINWKTQVIQ